MRFKPSYFAQDAPKRVLRLLLHLRKTNVREVRWWIVLSLLIAELLGVFDVYEMVNRWLLPGVGRLTAAQRLAAESVFGESLNYDRILIDNHAAIACKKGNFAYVSFHIVNHFGRIEDWHLIHELMHVWQYERVGAPYILYALQAQHSPESYNYGGTMGLIEHQKMGLRAFNFEQQADIIADYFRITTGLKPQWSDAVATELYEFYIEELRGGIYCRES